jgi:hypothetical protein
MKILWHSDGGVKQPSRISVLQPVAPIIAAHPAQPRVQHVTRHGGVAGATSR